MSDELVKDQVAAEAAEEEVPLFTDDQKDIDTFNISKLEEFEKTKNKDLNEIDKDEAMDETLNVMEDLGAQLGKFISKKIDEL